MGPRKACKSPRGQETEISTLEFSARGRCCPWRGSVWAPPADALSWFLADLDLHKEHFAAAASASAGHTLNQGAPLEQKDDQPRCRDADRALTFSWVIARGTCRGQGSRQACRAGERDHAAIERLRARSSTSKRPQVTIRSSLVREPATFPEGVLSRNRWYDTASLVDGT